MKFLLDTGKDKIPTDDPLIAGQLLTPLSRRLNWGGPFGIDNGAFAGFDRAGYFRLLEKQLPFLDQCEFVTVPDIVGNHRRTSELYFHLTATEAGLKPYTAKWSFVLQDGCEDARIDWAAIRHVFVGGTDGFKDSDAAYDVVRAAVACGIPVHVGRVNTIRRFFRYRELGASTCDGTGIAKYSHMLDTLREGLEREPIHQPELIA